LILKSTPPPPPPLPFSHVFFVKPLCLLFHSLFPPFPPDELSPSASLSQILYRRRQQHRSQSTSPCPFATRLSSFVSSLL
jgi:hypothetical protein